MSTKNDSGSIGHLVDFVDKNRTTTTRASYDMIIVNNLSFDIHRPSENHKCAVNDQNRTIDSSAPPPRCMRSCGIPAAVRSCSISSKTYATVY
jgi:hypothetical protein